MRAAVCAGAVFVAAMCFGTSAEANLIQNGSFELGSPSPGVGGYLTKNLGNTDITGWTVVGPTGGSIDWINGYWQAQDGTRSIDLNGGSQGGVSQTFATTSGATYQVDFWLAGNPDGNPATKLVQVNSGSGSQNFQFTTVLGGGTRSNMAWAPYQFTFVAGASSTTLSFLSQHTGAYGAALDNVSVNAVPEPAALALLGLAVPFLRRRRR